MASGRLNPDPQRAVARHEIKLTLSELIETAARMLRDGGRFAAVYPVERMADMLLEMRRGGLAPGNLRLVHPRENGPAKLFLVEGVKGGKAALEVPPPLILFQADGAYTQEAAAMFLP
jgi:tRNA1Val (adenine37-N6)-methyltransferase